MTLKAPFPYFGGKRRAAPLIWEALGDPGGYIEPFAGSAAALLARPAVSGRRIETLNDADGAGRCWPKGYILAKIFSNTADYGVEVRGLIHRACHHAGEEGLW